MNIPYHLQILRHHADEHTHRHLDSFESFFYGETDWGDMFDLSDFNQHCSNPDEFAKALGRRLINAYRENFTLVTGEQFTDFWNEEDYMGSQYNRREA